MPDSEEKYWKKQERRGCPWPGTPPTLAKLKSDDCGEQSRAWHDAFNLYCLKSTIWHTMHKQSYKRKSRITGEEYIVYAGRLNEVEEHTRDEEGFVVDKEAFRKGIASAVIEELKRKVIDEGWIPPEGDTFHYEIVRITRRITEDHLKEVWQSHQDRLADTLPGSGARIADTGHVEMVATQSKKLTRERKDKVFKRIIREFEERPEFSRRTKFKENAMCWLNQIVYKHKYKVMDLSDACKTGGYTGQVREFVFRIVAECAHGGAA